MAESTPSREDSNNNSVSDQDLSCGIDELTTASARGDLPRLRQLISARVDVNGRNEFGRTPLQVMKLNRTDVAEALLAAGADPNVREISIHGSEKRDTLLTPAHNAARAGFLDTLRMLIRYGADVNLVDKWGNTPAHWAAKNNHFEVVQYLSRAIRMDTARNFNMETPLHYQALQRTKQRKRWVKRQHGSPAALKDLACVRIRKLLGTERLRSYKQLPLAERDKKFLMLQD